VTVTGVPARHGPPGAEALAGDVVGFMLTSPDLPSVYISGDNAALELVEQIAARFAPVDTAILFIGRARHPSPSTTPGHPRQRPGRRSRQTARRTPRRTRSLDSWSHFKESRADIEKAFTAAGLADRIDFGRAQA
jgi:hypothetical protein